MKRISCSLFVFAGIVFQLLQRRPLFGVPFSCKDSLEVKGQVVTSGSYYRRNNICENTAVAVQRVQDAGGILLAITNVPELCSWVETTNCVYGRSNNPYDLRRIVGGSSGGEGALLSAAGTPIGVGSDVGGSIRIPSFVNGIFGLMPTPGVVPLDGHVPAPLGYKRQMLRIGPMCRYAEDLPLLLKVMAADELFNLQLDDTVDFRQCRVFFMLGIRHPLIEPLSDTMRETLQKVGLSGSGERVAEKISFQAVSHFEKTFNLEGVGLDLPLTLHHHEFYSASLDGNVPLSKKVLSLEGDAGQLNLRRELARLLSFKSHHTLATLMVIALETLSHSTEESRAESIRIRDRLKRQIVETLGNNGFLFLPSWPKPAPYHHEPLFAVLNTAYTALFNVLALPVVQCPMGLDANGIPLGIQVVAAPGCERLLVAVAKEISVTFGGWKPVWEK
ncbi:unnamed protein product [Heligmosomoides polygyrus]|uniref:Amidase domain-containing protein n=1 Tax=Heligmosomoides polygyrus TaxID=6339 RepID=A0A3P7XYB7_HELPZ|nr:unnamed protein product [Heligmosomoides polygyrus]